MTLYRSDYRRPVDNWRVAHVIGFHDLNWYAWNGNDARNRTFWDRGDSILTIAKRRLRMLWTHRRWAR